MEKLKEQQRKKDEQIRKLMYENEEKWRIKEQEYQQRYERKRRNVYNQRYAHK